MKLREPAIADTIALIRPKFAGLNIGLIQNVAGQEVHLSVGYKGKGSTAVLRFVDAPAADVEELVRVLARLSGWTGRTA